MSPRRPGADPMVCAVEVGHSDVSLALTEDGHEHVAARHGGEHRATGAGSADLAALRAVAERCGASAAEQHRRAPTNLARNYYDGGRDFDVWHTLSLTFASASVAARFLGEAGSVLAPWLQRRCEHHATLCVGEAELVLAAARDEAGAPVESARALLVRIARAQRDDPAPDAGGR